MKRLLGLILCMAFAFAMTGCGGASPTDTANEFLKALKSQNAETINGLYDGDETFTLNQDTVDDVFYGDDQSEDADENETFNQIADQFAAKLIDFDYQVTNEVIEGDKATVDVTITTYEFGKGFTNLLNDYISQAFLLAFDEDGEAKMDKLAETMFTTMVDELDEKSYKGTAQMSLSKEGDKWVVDEIEDDSQLMNVLTGGMIDSLETWGNTWGE